MKLFFALLMVLLQSPSQTQAVQAIQGRVLRAGTDRPVVRARVLIAPVVGSGNGPLATSISIESALPGGVSAEGGPGPRVTMKVAGDMKNVFTTLTDANGFFSLTNLPAATYRVFVEHDEYVFADYGVADPANSASLVIPLTPTGVIFGSVVDSFGEPQQGFTVRAACSLDKLQSDSIREIVSDDLGEFRLYGLAPGQYYVGAFPPPAPRFVSGPGINDGFTNQGGSMMNGPPAIAAGSVPTSLFAPEVKAAAIVTTPFKLEPGTIIDAGKLISERTLRIHVRGQFIDGRTGQIATVTLTNVSAIRLSPGGTAVPGPSQNGSFDFYGLFPGTYLIRGVSTDRLSGELEVEVRNSDIDNLRVILRPFVKLQFQVSPQTPQAQLRLTSTRIPNLTLTFAVPTDGKLNTPEIPAGDYRLNIVTPGGKTSIKTAMLGTTDVLANGLHVDDSITGVIQIEIH